MTAPKSATKIDAVVRLAATADVHFGRHPIEPLQRLFRQMSAEADIALICGDLTDHGDPQEARGLAREVVQHLGIPVVAVLGNHDYEADRAQEVHDVLRESGITVLDGDTIEIHGLGFAGVKGFCGGFGSHALGAWGEAIVKQFVHETVAEALKLETALARLRSVPRIALLHYGPVIDTSIGEPPEIFPFLGSSRLEEPLARYGALATFHGHAHRGQPQGKLVNGAPVFNVSFPMRHRLHPERPFELLEFTKDALAAPTIVPAPASDDGMVPEERPQ